MSAVADLEAVLADASGSLPGLRERRQVLALDALSDASAAEELVEVEGLIAAAERTLRLGELAGAERERRQLEAEKLAARVAREAAAVRVAELGVELEAAGRAVDLTFEAVCSAVSRWLELAEAQDRASVEAGGRPGANAHQARAIALDGAFRFGTRGLPMGVLGLEGFVQPRSVRPLADVQSEKGSGEDG